MSYESLKKLAAKSAIDLVGEHKVIGVGSGSTVDHFIDLLPSIRSQLDGVVAASELSLKRLKQLHIPILDLNSVNELPIYFDGADEINPHLQMIKGKGGALTREKIIAAVAKVFVCLADESKNVAHLGQSSIALEVIPMARSYVAREVVKLGGQPVYRSGFVTDNGNIILDIHHLKLYQPIQMEQQLNQIPGIVSNGIFALKPADKLILATSKGIQNIIVRQMGNETQIKHMSSETN